MLNRLLFSRIDNSSLLLFRIFFGILVALECYGAINTGWIKRTLIAPEFTFTFIGFEWLQPLPGIGMYIYFFTMGTLGICIALGFKYRFSIIAFTVMWTGVYLMQKTSYNNHYYLLILISLFLCFFPANRGYALDVWKRPYLKQDSMPSYVKWFIVLQLLLVYTYASVAKLYADWLDFGIIKILLQGKADYPIIGPLLQEPWLHGVIGISGILFDLLIVPALLWKPTRNIAFLLAIGFHLFNSIVFQIGIFPYLSLAFMVFFFEPEILRKIFFKKKVPYSKVDVQIPKYRNTLLILGSLYFLVQLILPIRHHFITDNVLWTEEGHRLSWRMMLRNRTGKTEFTVLDHNTGIANTVNLDAYLTVKQKRKLEAYPDFIWQFSQRLKKEYAKKGAIISVYVNSKVSVNGRPYRVFIDPSVDLANTPWEPFKHSAWIYSSEKME